MDQMYEIVEIVRSAISSGLIKSETKDNFNDAVANLKGPALEDYIQSVWDEIR